MKYLFALAFVFVSTLIFGQDYDSYMTGDPLDVSPIPMPGTVLMGGAGESDEAMMWFLERANGGDVVVIRASGSDGYNNYMFNELGVSINSVETIVFNNADAANDPDVIQKVQNAEAIWMAGGDQWDYVSYWRNTPIEDAINNLRNVKGGPVGGLSAGMAVLGGSYFKAQNGTVYSGEALANPYNLWMTLGHNDFLAMPYLNNVICDTHYDDPDRRGRHMAFMARMYTDEGKFPLGIACDEYSAVCVDDQGLAWCFGEFPDEDDFIYFVRPNCQEPIGPEICDAGTPITWDRNNQAVKAYRIGGTLEGDMFFDLNDWLSGDGGDWQTWHVIEGELSIEEDGIAPDCAVGVKPLSKPNFQMWPIPTSALIHVECDVLTTIVVFDARGLRVDSWLCSSGINQYDVSHLAPGVYLALDGQSSLKFTVE